MLFWTNERVRYQVPPFSLRMAATRDRPSVMAGSAGFVGAPLTVAAWRAHAAVASAEASTPTRIAMRVFMYRMMRAGEEWWKWISDLVARSFAPVADVPIVVTFPACPMPDPPSCS